MSTPVASRRCAVRNRTNPDSGDGREPRVARGEGVDPRRCRPPRHPGERALRIVGEVPVADRIRAGRRLEREVERPLVVRAGDQGQRLVERVAEAGVDVPGAVGVAVGRESADGEDEMVRHLVLGRARRDRARRRRGARRRSRATRSSSLERAVEVEAVAAAPAGGDPLHRVVAGRRATAHRAGSTASRTARAPPAPGGAGTARRPTAARRRGPAGRGTRRSGRIRSRPWRRA